MAKVAIEGTAPGEVVGQEERIKRPMDGSSGRRSRRAHCDGSVNPGTGSPVDVDARRVSIGGIDDAQMIVLAQEGVLVLHADFEVVDSLDVGVVRMGPGVGECAVLGDG